MLELLLKKHQFLVFSASVLALSACSTQGGSRYGDVQGTHCGTVAVPCAQVIEYHPVLVQPPPYQIPTSPVPTPCPVGQCPPVTQPPIVAQSPIISEPPVVVQPPVMAEPAYIPPVIVEPPYIQSEGVVDDPVISCPEGTIHSYGGQDCIPITVPRK